MIDTSYPNMSTEEIVDLLAGAAGVEIVRAENARRRAEYEAWQREPITEHMGEPLPGGPLVVGEWYDVSPGGGYERGRKWRQCRYLGRRRTRDRFGGYARENEVYGYSQSYVFERWGAKAGTDPYARAGHDTVGVQSRGFSVERITPDPKLLAKIEEIAAKKAEREAAAR